MRGWPALLIWLLMATTPGVAADPACPVADDLALHGLSLPATKAAVAAGHLIIMTMGGAASAGQAAHGAEFSYPVRMAARLRAALPNLDVSAVSRAAPRRSAAMSVAHLDADLAEVHPNLVIWGPGAIEAGSGTDIDDLVAQVEQGIAKIRDAGADLILIDLQYAPSIARVVNLAPYREAVQRVGEANGVPVLDRYELMRRWSQDGVLDLDVADSEARVGVARRLFDCLAAVMADEIVEAVR